MSDPPASAPGLSRWLIWLFGGLGVLFAVAVIFIAAVVFRDIGVGRQPAPVAGVRGEQFSVGSVERLAGTGLIAVEVQAMPQGLGGSASYDRRRPRNIVLVTTATGNSRRILPDNRSEITWIEYVPATPQKGGAKAHPIEEAVQSAQQAEATPPLRHYLMLVGQGNASSRLIAGDLLTTRQAEIAKGLGSVEDWFLIGPQRLALITREHETLTYRVVDLANLRSVQTRVIPVE